MVRIVIYMSDRQFNILLQAITAVSGKIDAFEMKTEQKFAEIDKRLNRIDIRLDEMDIRLDKIDVRLDEIDIRLDKIDVRLDEIDIRLNMMDVRIDKVYVRLNRINRQLNEHTDLIASIPQTTSDLINNLEKRHDKRITKIEKHLIFIPAR